MRFLNVHNWLEYKIVNACITYLQWWVACTKCISTPLANLLSQLYAFISTHSSQILTNLAQYSSLPSCTHCIKGTMVVYSEVWWALSFFGFLSWIPFTCPYTDDLLLNQPIIIRLVALLTISYLKSKGPNGRLLGRQALNSWRGRLYVLWKMVGHMLHNCYLGLLGFF